MGVEHGSGRAGDHIERDLRHGEDQEERSCAELRVGDRGVVHADRQHLQNESTPGDGDSTNGQCCQRDDAP